MFLKNGSDVTGDEPLTVILTDAQGTDEHYSIEFFYSKDCGACHVAMAYLNEFQAAHPDIVINSHDLSGSSDTRALFEQYKVAYNRHYVSVPSVFIGNAGLEGESAIRANFESLITWYEGNQSNTTRYPDVSVQDSRVRTHKTVISIPLVLLAGVVDGINPCACTSIIFLLIFLMTIRQRLRVLLAGMVFSSAVFFFYFLAGTGLITFSKHSEFVLGFSLISGILSIIAGIFVIKGATFPDLGPTLIPRAKKEEIFAYIEQMTIPVACILGFLAGILELPCTGGIYISILDMISFRVNMAQGLIYLILYNLAFIIPLLIITGLVFWGKSGHQGEEREPEQRRGIGIFMGILLFIFALLILSGVI